MCLKSDLIDSSDN